MALRPRLLVSSLAVAAVVGVAGGWALSKTSAFGGDDLPDDIVLDVPGEYQEPAEGPPSAVSGTRFPDVVLTAADGTEIRSSDLLGRPLVVNFWYSTCPPCERELQAFAEVHGEFGDRVRFVGVDHIDSPDVMEEFARDRGVRYELLRDPDGALVDALGMVTFPLTLFIDENGVIVGESGVLDADTLRHHIEGHF